MTNRVRAAAVAGVGLVLLAGVALCAYRVLSGEAGAGKPGVPEPYVYFYPGCAIEMRLAAPGELTVSPVDLWAKRAGPEYFSAPEARAVDALPPTLEAALLAKMDEVRSEPWWPSDHPFAENWQPLVGAWFVVEDAGLQGYLTVDWDDRDASGFARFAQVRSTAEEQLSECLLGRVPYRDYMGRPAAADDPRCLSIVVEGGQRWLLLRDQLDLDCQRYHPKPVGGYKRLMPNIECYFVVENRFWQGCAAGITVYEQNAFPWTRVSSYQGKLLLAWGNEIHIYDSLEAYLHDPLSLLDQSTSVRSPSEQTYICPPDPNLRPMSVVHPDDPFLGELTWLERERLILGGRSDGQQYLVVYLIHEMVVAGHESDPDYHGGALRYAGMLGEERFDRVLLNLENPGRRHNRDWRLLKSPDGDVAAYRERYIDFGTSVMLLDGLACLYNYPRDLFCLLRSDGLMDWWELEELLAPSCESIAAGASVREGCIASDGTYVYVGLGLPVQIWRFKPQWPGSNEWEVEFVGEIPSYEDEHCWMEVYGGNVLLQTDWTETLYVLSIEADPAETGNEQ